jgi:hypothetical protein
LRSAHHFQAGQGVGGEQLEPRLIAGGRIVEANAVQEQQGVIGLRAADPQLRLAAARSGLRHRRARSKPEEIDGQRKREVPENIALQHGGGNGRFLGVQGLARGGDDDGSRGIFVARRSQRRGRDQGQNKQGHWVTSLDDMHMPSRRYRPARRPGDAARRRLIPAGRGRLVQAGLLASRVAGRSLP